MARKYRYFVPFGYYNVYVRVARGEMIFDDPLLSEHWIHTAKKVAADFELRILAWCLMTNHFHLVLQCGTIPLWAAMARLQVTTAKFHNRQRRVLGRLWQSRYKAKLVQDQVYLEQLFAYVHLNPVAAGIVDDPLDYANCGHREILNRSDNRLVDRRSALNVFGLDVEQAKVRYLLVLGNLAEVRWLRNDVRNLPWWEVVANDHQIVEEEDSPDDAEAFDGSPVPEVDPRTSIGELIKRFEQARDLPAGELASYLRTAKLTRERQLLALFLVYQRHLTNRALANFLGRNPSSVTRWLNRATELNRTDMGFQRDFFELRSSLGQG